MRVSKTTLEKTNRASAGMKRGGVIEHDSRAQTHLLRSEKLVQWLELEFTSGARKEYEFRRTELGRYSIPRPKALPPGLPRCDP